MRSSSPLKAALQMFRGRSGFLPLGRQHHVGVGKLKIGAAIAFVVENMQTVQSVQALAAIDVELGHVGGGQTG